MNCINRTVSRHFDFASKATFVPLLLGAVYAGLAENLTAEQVAALEGREGFELLTGDELKALMTSEAEAYEKTIEKPEPTGDPVVDSGAELPTDYNELKKLAIARGIDLGPSPKKVDLIAALSESGSTPPPPPPPGS